MGMSLQPFTSIIFKQSDNSPIYWEHIHTYVLPETHFHVATPEASSHLSQGYIIVNGQSLFKDLNSNQAIISLLLHQMQP